MPRKTYSVLDALMFANYQLKQPHHSDEFKQGIIAFIEHILHDSGNYNGYTASVYFSPEREYQLSKKMQVERNKNVPSKDDLRKGIDSYVYEEYFNLKGDWK